MEVRSPSSEEEDGTQRRPQCEVLEARFREYIISKLGRGYLDVDLFGDLCRTLVGSYRARVFTNVVRRLWVWT